MPLNRLKTCGDVIFKFEGATESYRYNFFLKFHYSEDVYLGHVGCVTVLRVQPISGDVVVSDPDGSNKSIHEVFEGQITKALKQRTVDRRWENDYPGSTVISFEGFRIFIIEPFIGDSSIYIQGKYERKK